MFHFHCFKISDSVELDQTSHVWPGIVRKESPRMHHAMTTDCRGGPECFFFFFFPPVLNISTIGDCTVQNRLSRATVEYQLWRYKRKGSSFSRNSASRRFGNWHSAIFGYGPDQAGQARGRHLAPQVQAKTPAPLTSLRERRLPLVRPAALESPDRRSIGRRRRSPLRTL